LRFIYTLLFYLALPFIFIRLLWRSRLVPDNRKRFSERLGFCPFQLEKCIWVHAVSVGETVAAISLIKALQTQYTDIPIVVTSTTATGSARVKALLGDSVLSSYIPYDLPDAIARFLDRIHPVVAIILETELWPNLFAACRHRHIPIVIANACLSQKSLNGYQKIPSLTKDMLKAVSYLAAQGQSDADRYVSLGLSKDKVIITGNLKFNLDIPMHLAADAATLHQQLGKDRFIWIAASTHPGEEEIILDAHHKIKKNYPDALLILVPRHPNRFDTIATLCNEQGFNIARRSLGEICNAQTNIYLGDTMGEVLLMYSVADVTFVGGSFIQIGGHNILEPAALHKPILTGPHLMNVVEISEMLLQVNALFIVKNAEELAKQVQYFFADRESCCTVGENAYQVVQANRSALTQHMAVIKNALNAWA
jgi:3-deoxy-D-manno-octulosonic-acid transferase